MTKRLKYKYHICKQVKEDIFGRNIRINKYFYNNKYIKINKFDQLKFKFNYLIHLFLKNKTIHLNYLLKELKFLKIKKYNKINLNLFYKKKNIIKKKFKPILYKSELFEKQKLKKYYNLSEKQFSNIIYKSISHRNKLQKSFLTNFEQRIDSILFRNNFIHTFFLIRQFINHGNVLLNNKEIKVGNIQIKPGDIIQIKKKSIPYIYENILFNIKNNSIIINHPNYFETNYKLMTIIFIYYPNINEIPYHTKLDSNYVKQYYSR